IAIFGTTLFVIPYTTFTMPLFLIVMVIWGMMNWSLTPALQSYLIETSPETSDIQQSLNNSALHFGIAFGSFIGGMVIEQVSVVHNAAVGGMIVILSFGAALISMFGISSWKKSKTIHSSQKYTLIGTGFTNFYLTTYQSIESDPLSSKYLIMAHLSSRFRTFYRAYLEHPFLLQTRSASLTGPSNDDLV